MKKRYDFAHLVKKYSVDCILEVQKGDYNENGDFEKAAAELVPFRGAIVPLSARRIYQPGGIYTAKDKQLVTLKRIDDIEHTNIIYRGMRYTLEEDMDYTEYSEVSVYVMKWVSVNDREN